MIFNKTQYLFGLLLVSVTQVLFAADMLGNPILIGNPGSFDIQIGGGKSSDLKLDIKQSTGTFKVGTASGSFTTPTATGKLKEEQVFIRLAYTLNLRSQVFGQFGSGTATGQKSSSRSIGIKIVPTLGESDVKMGLLLRAQQVTVDMDGPFAVWDMNFSDSINRYIISELNGTEQIKLSRLDAFLGASSSTGIVRPYGGLLLSRISGTDTLSLNDTVSVSSCPLGGGGCSPSTEIVSVYNKADFSGSRNISGVLGLNINPDSAIGLTAELQLGVQRSVMLAGSIRF